MSVRVLLASAVVCCWAWGTGYGCIYEFGTIKEAAGIAGGNYTYSYNGLEWPNTFPGCRGSKQSPVLLPASGAAAKALGQPDAKSSFSYGALSNGQIVNNGHTLQVSLPDDFKSGVKIPIKGPTSSASHLSVLNGEGDITYVKATPAQFHFHTTSEHVMSGAEYPMEMHIVHFIKPDQLPGCANLTGLPGCPVVLGAMLALTLKEEEVKPELRALIDVMPLNEGSKATIPGDLNVNALLPDDKSYLTYEGSLTTPPCTEGLLWHVLTTPIKISQSLLTKYQEATGDLYCPDKKDDDKDKMANGTYFELPPIGVATDKKGCVKLANGHNWRGIQPLNGRPVKLAT